MKKYHIRLVLAVVASFLLFFLAKPEPAVINYPPKNDVVVAFGDSLVKGVGSTRGNDFVSKIGEKIGRPIINLGASGETSGQGLERVREAVSRNPGITLVLFGGNDYLRRVPEGETFGNLRQIISNLQSSGSVVVLLGVRGGILGDPFQADFEKLAKEMGVIYVPDVLSGLLGDSRYMSDAVHPNDAGYEIIAEKVLRAMKKALQ